MELYSDAYYIERIRKGDENCFACLLDKYSQRVFALVQRIVGNREDAEELTQDIFLQIYRKINTFKGDSSFSTWLYRIAYNASISETRKHKIDKISLEENLISDETEASLSNQLDQGDLQERLLMLEKALELLPPEDKALILLYYKEDKSIEELTFITSLTVSNIKVKLHRIRKRMLGLMEKMQRNEI